MKRYILSAALMMLSGTAFSADMMTTEPAAARNACSGHVEAYLGGINFSGGGNSETDFAIGRAHV